MPNNDDMEHGNSPITPPEGDIEEQEMLEPAPATVPSSKWNWVGSPDRPEAQKVDDGISDLFEVDTDDDTSDLVSVDLERDIIDGNLDDLTEVSEEDILGDEETGQVPLEYKPDAPRMRPLPRYRRIPTRYVPPTSVGGVGS